jgi:hypothetical protein
MSPYWWIGIVALIILFIAVLLRLVRRLQRGPTRSYEVDLTG